MIAKNECGAAWRCSTATAAYGQPIRICRGHSTRALMAFYEHYLSRQSKDLVAPALLDVHGTRALIIGTLPLYPHSRCLTSPLHERRPELMLGFETTPTSQNLFVDALHACIPLSSVADNQPSRLRSASASLDLSPESARIMLRRSAETSIFQTHNTLKPRLGAIKKAG